MNLLTFAELKLAVVCEPPRDHLVVVAAISPDTGIRVATLPERTTPSGELMELIWDSWLFNAMRPLTPAQVNDLLTE